MNVISPVSEVDVHSRTSLSMNCKRAFEIGANAKFMGHFMDWIALGKGGAIKQLIAEKLSLLLRIDSHWQGYVC